MCGALVCHVLVDNMLCVAMASAKVLCDAILCARLPCVVCVYGVCSLAKSCVLPASISLLNVLSAPLSSASLLSILFTSMHVRHDSHDSHVSRLPNSKTTRQIIHVHTLLVLIIAARNNMCSAVFT